MIHVQIERDGERTWYPLRRDNPDDALTLLALKGRYDFARGDRLVRVLKLSGGDYGPKLQPA